MAPKVEIEAEVNYREGFALYDSPTGVADFHDSAAVAEVHPGEIEPLMLELTGADAVAVVGGATLRFGERSREAGSRDNSYPARLVHIDSSDAAAMDFAKMAEPQHERAPHWLAHSAFDDPRAPAGCPPRASVEMRTIAYWYE